MPLLSFSLFMFESRSGSGQCSAESARSMQASHYNLKINSPVVTGATVQNPFHVIAWTKNTFMLQG